MVMMVTEMAMVMVIVVAIGQVPTFGQGYFWHILQIRQYTNKSIDAVSRIYQRLNGFKIEVLDGCGAIPIPISITTDNPNYNLIERFGTSMCADEGMQVVYEAGYVGAHFRTVTVPHCKLMELHTPKRAYTWRW